MFDECSAHAPAYRGEELEIDIVVQRRREDVLDECEKAERKGSPEHESEKSANLFPAFEVDIPAQEESQPEEHLHHAGPVGPVVRQRLLNENGGNHHTDVQHHHDQDGRWRESLAADGDGVHHNRYSKQHRKDGLEDERAQLGRTEELTELAGHDRQHSHEQQQAPVSAAPGQHQRSHDSKRHHKDKKDIGQVEDLVANCRLRCYERDNDKYPQQRAPHASHNLAEREPARLGNHGVGARRERGQLSAGDPLERGRYQSSGGPKQGPQGRETVSHGFQAGTSLSRADDA